MRAAVKTAGKRAAKAKRGQTRRIVYRPRRYDVVADPFVATSEAPAPEPIFDRVTGPFAAFFEEDL